MLLIPIIILLVCLTIKLVNLYYSASEKHRYELIQPTVFFFEHYCELPILIPRAFIPLFSVFEGKAIGITFHGVQTLIYDKHGNLLLGKRDASRAKRWLYDVGAAGMISGNITINNIVNVAKEELKEETNISPSINSKLVYVKTLMPCDGYPCIVHLFNIVYMSSDGMYDDNEIKSNDGTYTEIKWVTASYLKKLKSNIANVRTYSICTELLVNEL